MTCPAILRDRSSTTTMASVELPLDRGDATAILTGLVNANAKLDEIIYFLEIDDEEDEEPPDP
jgi:hypothetical protein